MSRYKPDRLSDRDIEILMNNQDEIIRSMAKEIQERRQADGWISVTEKLPESHKNVLVLMDSIDKVMMGINDDQNHWYIYWADGRKEENPEVPITHWMLLPEFPKQQ